MHPEADNRGDPKSAIAAPDVAWSFSGGTLRFIECLQNAIDEHAIVAVTDARGVIVYANDQFCQISKYARSELIGRTHKLINSGHHSAEFWREFWATISSGHVWRGVVCNRAKDGSLYWVDTTITPIPGLDGRPEYYIALRTEITRLKKVEEELGVLTTDLEQRVEARTRQVAESEKLYKLLLESVTDYHYTVEVRSGVAVSTQHTPSCLAVTGYREQDFVTDKDLWLKMVHEEDRPAVLAHARAALAGENPSPLEHRIVRSDGVVRWIRDRVVTRRDERGNVVFYDGIITDITAERLARDEIREFNQSLEQRVAERTAQLKAVSDQFRLIFEHAPVGISWVQWGKDGAADTHHLNDRFCRIVGLSREDAQSFQNLMSVTHPDDRPRQEAQMERVQHGDLNSFSIQKRYVRQDRSVVWGNLTVAVMRDEAGRITQQFAMLEDISDRIRAEEEVRRSEQRFRRYVENATEILYTLTPDGCFTFASPAWVSKLGHELSEVVGHWFAEFLHVEDVPLYETYMRGVLRGIGPERGVEYRIRHKDGTWRWHASTGAIIRDETGATLFFGVGRDVTLRRQAQEELRAALSRREELERIIDRSPSVVVLWRATESWPVEFVSRSISQWGYWPEDLTSGRLQFFDLLHPEDVQRIQEEVRAHAEAGHVEYRQEYRIRARNGEIHWVDDRTFIRTDEHGRVTHHEGILTDVTERKESERRQLASEKRDLQVASEVQQHLLPRLYPNIDEAEIESYYSPSRQVGGDYYDFFPVDERRWGFAIADVSGKGAAAALMMASCRTALRIKATGGYSPAAVLRMVNRVIQPDMPAEMFISMVYGILDLDTNTFCFCRAGHEPPLFVSALSGETKAFAPSGMPLGLVGPELFDENLEELCVPVEAHDMIVLYTDGITETANDLGEEFGRERLIEIVRAARSENLPEVRKAIDRGLRQFSQDVTASDDRTLLIVRPR